MDVEDIMTRKVMTMNCHETVLEAYKKYRDFKIGCLVIKDNERCVVGIVTERDLIERTININPEEKEKTLLIDTKKTEIKEFAASRKGLESLASQGESSEICFVETTYTDLLKDYVEVDKVGEVLDGNGNVVGEHKGYMHYTIDKRKGFTEKGAHEPH